MIRRGCRIVSPIVLLVVACSSGGSGGSGSPTTSGGSTPALPGTERAPCYPNGTCNQGLSCASNVCVNLGSGGVGGAGNMTGAGGASGGSSGGVGNAGGTVAAGGHLSDAGLGGSAGLRQLGDICDQDHPCAHPNLCEGDPSVQPPVFRCTYVGMLLYDPCPPGSYCKPGLFCDPIQSVCLECSTDKPCAAVGTLTCTNGKCVNCFPNCPVAGTGGAPGCGDTQNDPLNCGVCGHQCRQGEQSDCVAGKCQRSFGACLNSAQYTTCAAQCAAIGETCDESGCGGYSRVYEAWSSTDATCSVNGILGANSGAGSCTTPLLLSGSTGYYLCCCTDTH